MQKQCFKIFYSALIASLFIFQSCTTDNFEEIESSSESADIKITPAVEQIMQRGYEIEDIEEYTDFYLVEGDLVYSKDAADYSTRQTSRHYFSSLVNGNYIGPEKKIHVFSAISEAPSFSLGSTWGRAIDDAIDVWNAVGGGSCVKFELTTNRLQADIEIVDGIVNGLQENHFGWSGDPENGVPHKTIWINLQYPEDSDASGVANLASTNHTQKRNIIIHELGHCIGLRHTDIDTDYNPIQSTHASPDFYSIMRGGLDFVDNFIPFSSEDKKAIQALYGNCLPTITTCETPVSPQSVNVYLDNDGNVQASVVQDINANPDGYQWQVTGGTITSGNGTRLVSITPFRSCFVTRTVSVSVRAFNEESGTKCYSDGAATGSQRYKSGCHDVIF